MIVVADVEAAEADLVAGALACPSTSDHSGHCADAVVVWDALIRLVSGDRGSASSTHRVVFIESGVHLGFALGLYEFRARWCFTPRVDGADLTCSPATVLTCEGGLTQADVVHTQDFVRRPRRRSLARPSCGSPVDGTMRRSSPTPTVRAATAFRRVAAESRGCANACRCRRGYLRGAPARPQLPCPTSSGTLSWTASDLAACDTRLAWGGRQIPPTPGR